MTTQAIQRALLPVLLIEDEPSIMALVSATLERSGYEVVCVESGAEALHLLEDLGDHVQSAQVRANLVTFTGAAG